MNSKLYKGEKPSGKGLSAQDSSSQLTSSSRNSSRSSIKKPQITKQNPNFKRTRKGKAFFQILETLITAAAGLSDLTPNELNQMLVSAKIYKKTNKEIATDERMARIYADLHTASIPITSKRNVDQDFTNISPQDWISSNLDLQTQLTFKVIERAYAAAKLCNNSLTNDLHNVIKSMQTEENQLNRATCLASIEGILCVRYYQFAIEHGWMLLSILANSATFREAARTLLDEAWESLLKTISHNLDSLECFAKVRVLDWRTALTRIPECFRQIQNDLKERHPEITKGHPHTFVIDTQKHEVRRARYQGEYQINILESMYEEKNFPRLRPKEYWPKERQWPCDPRIRFNERCWMCRSKSCYCQAIHSDDIIRPLVELQEYPGRGAGVRALEPLFADEILDEYIGEVLPPTTDDRIYSLAIGDNPDNPWGVISSCRFGNWTRYISHSCNPNTQFSPVCIGGLERTMIRVVREVALFEEITVGYGDDYFGRGMACLCGEDQCRFPPLT